MTSASNPRSRGAVRQEIEAMINVVPGTWADELKQQFLKEGRAEGRAEGSLQARREDLRELLTARFGPLPDSVLQKIEATTGPERLRDCPRRIMTMASLDDLGL
jgi:hypothetical protein